MKEDINCLIDMLFCRSRKHVKITKELLEPLMDHANLVWLKDFCKISSFHASKTLYNDGVSFEPREYANKATHNFARIMANELCMLHNVNMISILGYFAVLNFPISIFQYNGVEYIISIYSPQYRKHILFDTQNTNSVYFARRDTTMDVTISLITTNYQIGGAADVFKYISSACGHSYFEKIELNMDGVDLPIKTRLFLSICKQFEIMRICESFNTETVYLTEHRSSMTKIQPNHTVKSEESFDFDLTK